MIFFKIYDIIYIQSKERNDIRPTAYEFETAKVLVEALVEYGLVDNLQQYVVEDWYRECGLRDADYYMSGGATKLCITHDDLCDWVIKVGYNKNVKHDYAKREYEIYCEAIENGLGEYFPMMAYLGEFGGCCFYLQELADCCEEQITSNWYENLIALNDETGEYEYYVNNDMVWDLVYDLCDYERLNLLFGDSMLNKFFEDRHIGDFHEGNFGYIGDRCVIIDFAGWREMD